MAALNATDGAGFGGPRLEPTEIRERIEAEIPGARARVEGAEAHFSAVVVAEAFRGKSRVEQHQMIYALFQKEMASQAIHALALTTRTPEESPRDGARQER
jgi:acid stress-induced BolA-like protein IbaG/YrbA